LHTFSFIFVVVVILNCTRTRRRNSDSTLSLSLSLSSLGARAFTLLRLGRTIERFRLSRTEKGSSSSSSSPSPLAAQSKEIESPEEKKTISLLFCVSGNSWFQIRVEEIKKTTTRAKNHETE